jgi:hypothetical protein
MSSWEAAGRALGPEHERVAWEAIEGAGGTAAFDLIVLSGSFVAGHAHGYSDVDIYVVTAEGVTVEKVSRLAEGIPVQFNPIEPATMAAISEMFAAYRVTPADRTQLFAMQALLRDATRLAFGRLLHVSDRLREAYRACDRDVIRQLTMTNCGREVGRHIEDAAGGLDADDPLIALQGAETAARFAVEAALAACGDVYIGQSFFWRRLTRVDRHGELVRFLWRLLKDGPAWGTGDDELRARVIELLDLSAYLVSTAQLDGWHKPMDGVPLPSTGNSRLRRNPYYSVLRFGDTISIIGPDKAYRSNEATARLWLGGPAGGLSEASIQQFRKMGLLVPTEEMPGGR